MHFAAFFSWKQSEKWKCFAEDNILQKIRVQDKKETACPCFSFSFPRRNEHSGSVWYLRWNVREFRQTLQLKIHLHALRRKRMAERMEIERSDTTFLRISQETILHYPGFHQFICSSGQKKSFFFFTWKLPDHLKQKFRERDFPLGAGRFRLGDNDFRSGRNGICCGKPLHRVRNFQQFVFQTDIFPF